MIGDKAIEIGKNVSDLGLNNEDINKYKNYLTDSIESLAELVIESGHIPIITITQSICGCGETKIISTEDVIKSKFQTLGILKELVKDMEIELKNIN